MLQIEKGSSPEKIRVLLAQTVRDSHTNKYLEILKLSYFSQGCMRKKTLLAR